jgi:hypothetical protein
MRHIKQKQCGNCVNWFVCVCALDVECINITSRFSIDVRNARQPSQGPCQNQHDFCCIVATLHRFVIQNKERETHL